MKNYYVILGVKRGESPRGIRSAYRDLAKKHHPDRVGRKERESFLEIKEAYETLSDPEKRRLYNHSLDEWEGRHRALRRVPEPEVVVAEPMSILHESASYRPSFEALLQRLLRNFTGRGVPKGEEIEGLNFEVILTPDEAARGVVLPIQVPAFHPCPFCGGTGKDSDFPCTYCLAEGVVETEQTVRAHVPAMVRSGTVFEIPLRGLGIHNFYLRLHILVSGW